MSKHATTPGRIAGIDFGTVRIGIAITDAQRRLASPLETYIRRDRQADERRFRQLVADEGITMFVVGLPLHLSGDESPKSREARRFGDWLNRVTGIDIEYFDERFTSVEAEHMLREASLTNRRRKDRRDMLAAQIMLTAYLESSQMTPPSRRSLDD